MRKLLLEKNCNNKTRESYEILYSDLMIGCIHSVFSHSTLVEDRKKIIQDVVNNNYIQLSTYKKRKFKNSFILFLTKHKHTKILYLIFSIRYRRKD